MLEIKLNDVDELCELSRELGIITYLQSLVEYDKDGDVIREEGLQFIHSCTLSYLWDKQLDVVKRFRKLLEKEDFAREITNYC